MSPFEFVATFFSIVLGLGVAHLLSSVSDLIEARSRVRVDWIHSLWVVTVFMLLIHSWWGMWDLKYAPSWSYPSFIYMVGLLCMVYLLSTIIFPRVPDEGTIDLRAHFDGVRSIFLCFMAAGFALAVFVNHSLFQASLTSQFVILPAILVVTALVGAATRSRIYHGVLITLYVVSMLTIMVTDTTTIK